MHRTDEQLAAGAVHGDRAALGILIQRYLTLVYRFAYRIVGNAYDAEDIAQETFVKVWKHLKRFDERKSFKTWMLSIAKNTALDFLKKKKAVPFSSLVDGEGGHAPIEEVADSEMLPSELFDRADLVSFFAAVFAKLSPHYRVVLTLHYNEQLSFREIGEVLGEPLHTVKSRHRRAIIALRALCIAPKSTASS